METSGTRETIRKATVGDLPAVYALFREFAEFQRTPEKLHITPEQLERDAAYFHCLVAVVDGRIVGFASYSPVYYSWTGRAIYLDDLYVQEASRQSGIGKRLLEAVITRAREAGCASVQETEMVCVLPL